MNTTNGPNSGPGYTIPAPPEPLTVFPQTRFIRATLEDGRPILLQPSQIQSVLRSTSGDYTAIHMVGDSSEEAPYRVQESVTEFEECLHVTPVAVPF